MIINVVTLIGRKMTFEIDGSHKLRDLQHAVQDSEGLYPDQQRYIFAGVMLVRGLLVDQIEKIRLQNEQISTNSSIDISLIVRLRGGGNQIFPRTLDDDESSEDELPPNQVNRGTVKIESASKPEEGSEPHQILRSSSNHQSSDSQLDHNQNSLYYEGIDQLIQGMNSLRLFKCRVDAVQSAEKIVELNKKISEMEAEIADLKLLAKDAEDRGYKRGCEVAWGAMRNFIAREHPEWDLSFLN